jgi:hypothetical protein
MHEASDRAGALDPARPLFDATLPLGPDEHTARSFPLLARSTSGRF